MSSESPLSEWWEYILSRSGLKGLFSSHVEDNHSEYHHSQLNSTSKSAMHSSSSSDTSNSHESIHSQNTKTNDSHHHSSKESHGHARELTAEQKLKILASKLAIMYKALFPEDRTNTASIQSKFKETDDFYLDALIYCNENMRKFIEKETNGIAKMEKLKIAAIRKANGTLPFEPLNMYHDRRGG